jgi:hypothetical protein
MKKPRIIINVDNNQVWTVKSEIDVDVVIQNMDLQILYKPTTCKTNEKELNDYFDIAEQLNLSFSEVLQLHHKKKK